MPSRPRLARSVRSLRLLALTAGSLFILMLFGGFGSIDHVGAQPAQAQAPAPVTADATSDDFSECYFRERSTINGRLYRGNVFCDLDGADGDGFVSYDLAGRYDTFSAVLGINDFSRATDATVNFRVLVDGILVESHDLQIGSQKRILVDVGQAETLRLEAKVTAGTADVWAQFASARLSAGDAEPRVVRRPAIAADGRLLANADPVTVDNCAPADLASIRFKVFSPSMRCALVGGDTVGSADYTLARRYRRFVTTVGQSDYSVAKDAVVAFRIYEDGVQTASYELPHGVKKFVSIDVVDTNRLRIEAELLSGSPNVWAEFAQPRLRINRPPVGRVGSSSLKDGVLTVRGWSYDPDHEDPVSVHLLIDGEPVATSATGMPRPALDKAHRGDRSNAGYLLQGISVPPGSHTYCVRTTNDEGVARFTTLGCETIRVPRP